jgi:hypothetical protein
MNEADLLDPEVEAPAVETPAAEPSLRDTIAKAFDEQEAKVTEPTPEGEEPAAKPAAEPGTPAADAKPEAKTSEQEAAKPAEPGELKAPAQWKPAIREKWGALPLEVKQEILRREGDSMRLIGSVGPKIRLADEVSNHIQPFAERLQANGVSPSAFLGDLFTSVKALTSSNPQEKAAVVANMIQSYGIDVRMLDAMLSQRLQQPPEVAEARRLAARAESTIQQHQQSIEHQNSLEAEKALAAFGADPKHEFLDDVRDLMADLIEANRATSLDDAYSAAIWAHPDTRKILLQREAQARTEAKANRAAVARKASASVHGSPAGSAVAPTKANMSVREAVEAAFDEHTSL